MDKIIEEKVDRDLREEILYMSIADKLGIDVDQYLTRDDLEKAIFSMVNVHHTIGLSCAKASKLRMKPYNYEGVFVLLTKINEKIGDFSDDHIDNYSESFENFAHPDGLLFMGNMDDDDIENYFKSGFDVMEEVAIMLGVIASDEVETLERLQAILDRVSDMKLAGEMCALSYDMGINPYRNYKSAKDLSDSLPWEEIEETPEKFQRYTKYKEYCKEYFQIQIKEFPEIVKNMKELYESPNDNVDIEDKSDINDASDENKENRKKSQSGVDFAWKEELDDLEKEDFEKALEYINNLKPGSENIEEFFSEVYGLNETEKILETYGINPIKYESPLDFVEAIVNAVGGPYNLEEKVLVHLIGVVTGAPLEYVDSAEEVLEALYFIYKGNYLAGRAVAKALDMGKDPYNMESGHELMEFIHITDEELSSCPRVRAYEKICKFNAIERNTRLGYAELVAESIGIMVADGDNMKDVLIKILGDAFSHENPGFICAVVTDLGFDPYSGYESMRQMISETHYYENMYEILSKGTVSQRLKNLEKYTNLEASFMEEYFKQYYKRGKIQKRKVRKR